MVARHALLVQRRRLGQRGVECIDGRYVGEIGRPARGPMVDHVQRKSEQQLSIRLFVELELAKTIDTYLHS